MDRKTFLQLGGVATLAACVPSAPQPRALTRAEIAPLLIAVYVGMTGEVPAIPDCPFVDIDDLPSNQQDAICQLWGLGVVVGTERDVKFSPELPAGQWGDVMLKNLAETIK